MKRIIITQEIAETNVHERCLEKNYTLSKPFKYENMKTRIYLKCNIDNYHWDVRYSNFIYKKTGCPKCSNTALPTQQEIELKISQRCLMKNFSLIETFKYKNSQTKIHFKCNIDGYEWYTTYYNLNKTGCRKCNKTAKLTYREFKKNILERCKEVNCKVMSPIVYDNTSSKIHLKCNIDGYEWFPEYNNFINSRYGCPKCSKVGKLSQNEMENNIINRCNEMDYSLIDNVICNGSKTKFKIKCNVCDNEWTPNYNNFYYKKTGCPKCNQSKGELNVANYLNLNNIQYFREYKFDKCKYKRKLPFDFYLPEYNLCIEFDGEQHFKPQNCWGGDNDFKIIRIRDEIKNKYCLDNNINLIRIKYNENIEEILNIKIAQIK